MRTLSSTLTAAQKRTQALAPVIALEVSDRPVEMPRFDWTQVSGEAVASCHGAAVVCDDSSVARVRVKTSGDLQVARIAAPYTDNWATAWGTLGSGYNTTAQAALGAATDSGTVIIAYVSGDGLTLYYRVSTDRGATYGAEQTLATLPPGMAYKGVALCGGAGYVYIAYTSDSGAAEPNDTVTVNRYDVAGAAWGAPSADPGHDSVVAVGTALEGTRQLVLLGGLAGLERRDWDWNSSAWQTVQLVMPVVTTSGYTLNVPRVAVSPDGSGRYFYSFLERWTVSNADQRNWLLCTPNRDTLGEGLLFPTNSGKGWDLFCLTTVDAGVTHYTWYAVCATMHYTAPKYTGSATQKLDVGSDVLAFEVEEPGENKPGRARVWLRNEDGRYATPGSGTYAMLREGSRACLGLGYTTSGGSESVWLPPMWVERWAYEELSGGEACLVLELGDSWSYLDRCVARYPVSYAGLTFAEVAAKLLYRVTGATLATAGGLDIGAGTFVLRPGESIGSALRRIMDRAGVGLRFGTSAVSGDPGHWNAATVTAIAYGAGASGYSFGPASHPVLRAVYGDRGQRVNLVEVFGLADWDYQEDSAHITAAGHVFVEKEVDLFLDSAADATSRVATSYAAARRRLSWGWLECLPHVGAELFDLIDVTASRAGLSAAGRRIAGIHWRYDGRKTGRWWQRLELEGE